MASAVDPEISPEPPPELQVEENRWEALADRGELCVYTCLSLKIGGQKAGEAIDWNLASTFVAPVALQVVVPALMLVHEIRNGVVIATAMGLEFRIVGFILYLYSIRSMYNNALDECRSILLEMALQYNLPFNYVWPLVLGEVINSFAAFTLCLTLFTVFCQAANLRDLVINCIAINFIGNVDSEFCTPQLKEFAVGNFQTVARERFNGDEEPETCSRSLFEKVLALLLWLFRTFGTLGIGTFLACVFLFSHKDD